jgi:nucleoside-diphosphate-sugar epimerase
MATFTVIGAQGFIGGRLAAYLSARGHDVATPPRCTLPAKEPGHIVYCAGVTADFRSRPFDTVAAHVGHLAEVLAHVRPESFLYLSSTRVYGASGYEDVLLTVDPSNPDDLYNATKIAGEALCLAQTAANVRVARLSNVYGSGMASGDFLSAILAESLTGRLHLATAYDSEKDYVAVEDVVRAVERIALFGRHRLYNVASGRNVTHRALAERLARLTGCRVTVDHDAPRVAYPVIETRRLAAEFDADDPWSPADLFDRLPGLVTDCRRARQPEELAS